MEITDIIGEGNAFEPPFKTNRYGSIMDKNGIVVMCVQNFQYMFSHFPDDETFGVTIVADHICDLLNREHYKKGGE